MIILENIHMSLNNFRLDSIGHILITSVVSLWKRTHCCPPPPTPPAPLTGARAGFFFNWRKDIKICRKTFLVVSSYV